MEKWSENIFNPEYIKHIKERGYQAYLNSDRYLDQIWGAAALLADRVDTARVESRGLAEGELNEVREALLRAANSTHRDGNTYAKEGEEIEELSKNVPILAEIMRRLR